LAAEVVAVEVVAVMVVSRAAEAEVVLELPEAAVAAAAGHAFF
jgi:hypothetical protein